jgi:ribonuclease VapC
VILAILFGEEHAAWAAEKLRQNRGDLTMSTVNLTEVLVRLEDRRPDLAGDLEDRILGAGIRFVPPDVEQARIAARARLRFPLNLGDCFAYALARVERSGVLTIDADFRAVDVQVVLPEG